MISFTNRSYAETYLANALSRHVGYTTAAYELSRIFSVVDFFNNKASAINEEIKSYLLNKYDASSALTEGYISEVINFTTSFGLVEIVGHKGQRFQSYTLTQQGRAFLAIRHLGISELQNFTASKIILLSDADFALPILSYFKNQYQNNIKNYFIDFITNLYKLRFNWLLNAFTEKILFQRIVDKITWLKQDIYSTNGYIIQKFTDNTARHHVTPRIGWLSELNWVNKDEKTLTPFGEYIYHSLLPNHFYFWLAPPYEVLKKLGINLEQIPESASEDNFLKAFNSLYTPDESQYMKIVDDVAKIMSDGFEYAKLVYSRQATLLLPIMYIEYRIFKDKLSYDWEYIMNILFSKYKNYFERLSAKVGRIGFFRLKKRFIY